MTPIIVSMIFGAGAALAFKALFGPGRLEQCKHCDHYLVENTQLHHSLQALAAENERFRNIIEQPEGPCVQLAMSGYVPTVMH